jgi:hypothetical protein
LMNPEPGDLRPREEASYQYRSYRVPLSSTRPKPPSPRQNRDAAIH